MAVSKSMRVFLFILAATTMLISCAKKDSDFKGRKNSAGAGFVGDGGKNQRADTTANALGMQSPDIVGIQMPTMNQQGGLNIISRIAIGQSLFDITMSHYPSNMRVNLSKMIGSDQLVAEGLCVTNTCSPYYLNIMILRNNQPVKQIVMKKFFVYENESSTMDYVIQRDGREFESLDSAVQILDQAVPEEQ